MDSILGSIKKLLGIAEENTDFDQDIIMHINTVFMILNQLGVIPSKYPFMIVDSYDVWNDFIPPEYSVEAIKTYIYLKVRMIFDPPQSASTAEAIRQNIAELESRLNMMFETKEFEGWL